MHHALCIMQAERFKPAPLFLHLFSTPPLQTIDATEINTRSPGQALALLSEGGPRSVSRVLSEILARNLGVQDFLC